MIEINYLILAHKNPKQLKRLINRLNAPWVKFYIHIDNKIAISPFLKIFDRSENIEFISKRVLIQWGHISMVNATLNLMKAAIKNSGPAYFILLSGQDYPLKSNDLIKSFLMDRVGSNFIDMKPISEVWENYAKRLQDYTIFYYPYSDKALVIKSIFNKGFFSKQNIKRILQLLGSKKIFETLKLMFKKRTLGKDFEFYGGNQWWALSDNSLRSILEYIDKNPSYYNFHKNSLVPDEFFFHTLIAFLIPRRQICKGLTYVNWLRSNKSPVTFKTDQDFLELKKSDKLFARKFDEDSEILNRIDQQLLS